MSRTLDIQARFRSALRRDALVTAGDTVLVGLSGGPDSVALLSLFREVSREYRLSLRAAHLDHGLRTGSAADARFVRALCRESGIPLVLGRARIRRGRKGSLEEAARTARFAFLMRSASRLKADSIALGHNLDDQAETVLMRILRGTGLSGLAAIMPKRTIAGHTLIRPLLSVKRAQIEAYLRRKKLRVLRDPSNEDEAFTRNKLRKSLIPLLEKGYCAKVKEQLATLAESAGADYDYLQSQALRLMKPSRSRFTLVRLRRMHPALRRIVFREALRYLQGSTRRITFQHIRELEDLLCNRPAGSIVDLPHGISCRKTKPALQFYRKK